MQSDTCFGILPNFLNYFFITPQSNNFSYKIRQALFLWLLIKSYAYFVYFQQFLQICTVKLTHLCFTQHIYSIWEIFFLFLTSELILISNTKFKFLGPLKQLGPKNLCISQSMQSVTVKHCCLSTQVYEDAFKCSSSMENRSKKYILFIIMKRGKHNNFTRSQVTQSKQATVSSFLSQTCSKEFALFIF